MGTRYNYDNGIPCNNPNCRSYGKPHPNCKCGGGGLRASAGRTWEKVKGVASSVAETYGASGASEGYANGGEVHHCSTLMPHDELCEHFANGGQVQENQQFAQDPALSLDHAIIAKGLHHVLSKSGHTRSQDHGRDFMEAAKYGRKAIDAHAKNLFNDSEYAKSNDDDVAALENHLEEIQMNPKLAEDIGGSLGDNLPDHHLQMAGKLASILNYFSAIKPKAAQGAPLDNVMPPSQKERAHYKRQLAVAQNPALIYEKAKRGMLQPGDLHTMQAIYPKLNHAMVNAAGDAIVDAKHNGVELPKNAKQGVGMLMGQSLSFMQTPAAMQAIIAANAPEQQQGRKQLGGSQNKPTDLGVRESNKQAQIEATQSQERKLRDRI